MIIREETIVPAPSRITIYNAYQDILLGRIHGINVSRNKSAFYFILYDMRQIRDKKGWTQRVGLANVSPKGLYHGIRGWFKLDSGS